MDMQAAGKAAARAAAVRNTAGVQLIYTSHPAWPRVGAGPLDIAVLDSSFNPPSKAHLALLRSPPLLAPGKQRYDGHLLLFSTQNADKGAGKPGDASLEQRATMMTLLARDLEHHTPNIAVALVDKPLIFDKSTLTRALLHSDVRLHWVVGFDTLYRVFQLKYYPSPAAFRAQCTQFFERERTTFVCARRDPASFPSLAGEAAREDELLRSDSVRPWVQAGCIAMLDIDPAEAALSSTHIRGLLADTTTTAAHKKHALAPLVPPSLVDYLVEAKVYGC